MSNSVLGGILIKKISGKRKIYVLRILNKCKRKKYKLKKYLRSKRTNLDLKNKKGKLNNSNKYLKTEIEVPVIFDLKSNYDEVQMFFQKIIYHIEKAEKNIELIMNLDKIEKASNESIIYLIALITNIKIKKANEVKFAGKTPKNEIIKKSFIETGFFYYLDKDDLNDKNINSTKGINIKTGRKVESSIAGGICKFTQEKLGLSLLDTKQLYSVIIEVMNNTYAHARNSRIFGENRWFVFFKEYDDYVQYIFLDTGAGIPNTVRKNFKELVKNIFNKSNSLDSFLLESALKGEFRSKTKERTRGKGLPNILYSCYDKHINDVEIFTCKTYCSIDSKRRMIIKEDKKHLLNGTLFTWKVYKKENNYGNH